MKNRIYKKEFENNMVLYVEGAKKLYKYDLNSVLPVSFLDGGVMHTIKKVEQKIVFESTNKIREEKGIIII